MRPCRNLGNRTELKPLTSTGSNPVGRTFGACGNWKTSEAQTFVIIGSNPIVPTRVYSNGTEDSLRHCWLWLVGSTPTTRTLSVWYNG